VVKRSGDHDDEEGGGGGGGASKKRKQDDVESQHPITLPIPESSWEESKLVETQERLQKMVFIIHSLLILLLLFLFSFLF
jgi:hypothetical protein